MTNTLEIGTVDISVSNEVVCKLHQLRVNGNSMTKVFFRQLPTITIDAALNGKYLGIVRIEERLETVEYIVILHDSMLYKGELYKATDFSSFRSSEYTITSMIKQHYENGKLPMVDYYRKEHNAEIDRLTAELAKLYTRLTLSILLNKLNNNEIIEYKTEYRDFISFDLFDKIKFDCVNIENKVNLAWLLDRQLPSSEFKTNIVGDILVGWIPNGQTVIDIKQAFLELALKMADRLNTSLSDIIVEKSLCKKSVDITDKEELQRNIAELTSQSEEIIIDEQWYKLISGSSLADYSEKRLTTDLNIRVTVNRNNRWRHSAKLVKINGSFNIFNGSIKTLMELADKYEVTGANEEVMQLKAEFKSMELSRTDLLNKVENQKEKARSTLKGLIDKANRDISEAKETLLLIGKDLA